MKTEKIKFQIFRDADRRPTVTICRIDASGEIGIGMAIRSIMDNPVERTGKAKAYGRAKKALYHRKNSLPILREEAYNSLSMVGPIMVSGPYKSIYQP